jgi:hypothetical protein
MDVEQYVHTLIAADSAFVPKPPQLAEFFEGLVTAFHFRLTSGAPSRPPLRVVKPTGRLRTALNPLTGETWSFPASDHIGTERLADIPGVIDGLDHYSVLASGEWKLENRPMVLLTADGNPYEDSYLCEVSCHLRPKPVSTSCWNGRTAPEEGDVPIFGEACAPEVGTGIFSHPWTGEMIKVPDAGCARFWIEFEFGKFLLPEMADRLDVLSPPIVAKTDECFETGFVQGWTFR